MWLPSICVLIIQGPAACHSCRHSQEGSDCVAECPSTKYPDSLGHCMPYHPFCDQAYGCTGPWPGLVEVQPGQNPDEYGGCYRCIFGQYQRDSDSCPTNCLDPNLETCPVGYYMNYCGRVRVCMCVRAYVCTYVFMHKPSSFSACQDFWVTRTTARYIVAHLVKIQYINRHLQ